MYNSTVVVPRYSTAGLIGRSVARQLYSCVTFYLLLRVLGTDPLERGPLYVIALIIAFQLFGIDNIILDLKANRELRHALATGGDLDQLSGKWSDREIRIMRIYAVLGLLVGIAMTAGYVDLPGYDVPNWVGAPVVALAIVLFTFARRLANPRSVKSMTINIIPPGFKVPE